MRILLAVDASACSRAAMQWVTRMTWPSNSEFIVMSAAQPALASCPVGELPDPMSASRYRAEVDLHEDIAAECASELVDHGWLTHAVVMNGDPRPAIVDAARQYRVDLVVVGSHGRSGLSKLLLGSVADHLVAHAPCPVLVIKAEQPEPLQAVAS